MALAGPAGLFIIVSIDVIDVASSDLWKNWVKEGEIIEGGITVPDRPGIGVEMNDEATRKAQMPSPVQLRHL
jgi:L-alanine-DL-glutamate epimerase-like enolase superfamily enzyme